MANLKKNRFLKSTAITSVSIFFFRFSLSLLSLSYNMHLKVILFLLYANFRLPMLMHHMPRNHILLYKPPLILMNC